jgi:hypothetical protein
MAAAQVRAMRWALAVAAFLVVGLSGCVSTAGSFDQDCTTASSQAVAVNRSLLLPEEPTDTPYQDEGNRIVVHAREGQDVVAYATWQVGAGQAQAVFDGPRNHQTMTDGTWTLTTYGVPAGEYALEMVGAPFAFEAVYNLQIVAFGCTPA